MTRARAARWTEWALRLSLATAFLSAVGDRLGAWAPHGSPHVSWGDWRQFAIYADRLNWYMPTAVQTTAAVLATAAGVIFALALITGFRLRETALGSGVLLTIFGISMAIALGIKAPLDYPVFTAAENHRRPAVQNEAGEYICVRSGRCRYRIPTAIGRQSHLSLNSFLRGGPARLD